jgi:hypothetical protein
VRVAVDARRGLGETAKKGVESENTIIMIEKKKMFDSHLQHL